MARIGSYPIDAVIQDKDAWIGTENTNRVTRQFTALGVAQYIDTKNVGLVFVGATNLLPGKKGLVPAPLAGQEGMFLKGDLNGGWTTIPVYTLDVPTGTTNVNLINTDGAGAIINSFITLTGGTYLTSVHTSGSQITFNHDDTVRTDPTNPTPTPGPGASVDLVSAVASNATGHVTGVTTSTVTWPADSTYTIDVPNATTSINLKGSDGTNDPIAFTTVAGNNGMTISRTDANTLNFNSKWQINNVNQDGYVPKGLANANKFWATDGNGNPGWTFQPSQDQTLTSTGTTNASTGVVLSQNGGTVIIKGDGSTISASSNNTTNVITLEAINRVNTTYTLPVAVGAANTAVINLTDNSAVVSSVTFNGTANKIAISETVGNNGDITIGMPDDVTVTGELTVSGTGQSSFGGQITIPQTPSADTDAASKKYVDDLVSGGLTFRGTFNAATGEILSGVSDGSYLYNCPGGAGTRIAVAVGDYYIVATAGGSFYCSGVTLDIGDSIIATAAAGADASVVTGWSVVQSDEGVASFTNANGTFVSAGTVNSNATGAVTMGTIDLSATGTKDGTTFLRGDNTWAVPAYVSYSAMTTSTLGLGKIKYDNNSTPAANSQSTTTARTYGVTKNSSDQLIVNVPWLNSSDVNSVTASGATTALSGLSSTPNTGAVVIGLDINGRESLGSPAADDELMIYDTSTAKNVKVLVSDLASYAGSAATNQVTYWTSANAIGGAAGFTFNGTGRVTAAESFNSVKDGADTVADGPFFGLKNADSSRQYINQLDASNNIDYWYYNGSVWAQTISLLNNGGATFAGNIRTGGTTITAASNFDNVVIEGTSHTGINIISGSTGTASDGGIYFGDQAANNSGQLKYIHSSNSMIFITNDGNPSLTLDSGLNSTFAGNVNISSAGDLYINSGTSYNNKGSIFMSNQRTEIVSDIVDGTANGDTSLNFKTRKAGATASALFIDEFRKIGIGTDDPEYKVHQQGTGLQRNLIECTNNNAGGAGVFFRVMDGASQVSNGTVTIDNGGNMKFFTGTSSEAERMRIDSSGNTTITTTSNQGGLTVTSATDNTVVGINNTATGGQDWRLQSIGGSSGSGQGKLLMKVGGGETEANLISFITDGSGNNIKMGIGTTSPNNGKLTIKQNSSAASFGGNVCQLFENFDTTDGQMMSIGFRNNNSIGTTAYIDAVAYDQSVGATDIRFSTYSGSAWNSNMVTFQHTGRVGIGTTSPSEKLQVKGNICVNSESVSTATAEIDKIEFKKSHPNGVSGYYTLGEIRSKTVGGYSGGLNFYTGRATTPGSYASTFAMTIDQKGQVGIGKESLPTDVYTASGGGYAVLGMGQSSFLTAYKADDSIELCQNTYLKTNGTNQGVTASVAAARLTLVDGSFVFATLQTAADKSQTAVNAMKITEGAELFVGETGTNLGYSSHHISKNSPSGYALIVRNSNTTTTNNTTIQLNRADTTATTQGYFLIARQGDTSSGTNRFIIFANGNAQNTNNSYGALSDERKKENIVDATPKLDDLMKVKVRNFNLKGEETKQIGVVAQELEEVFPGMISESKDPDSDDETLYKSVKYSVFVPMLIKAIQELKAEIEILKNK